MLCPHCGKRPRSIWSGRPLKLKYRIQCPHCQTLLRGAPVLYFWDLAHLLIAIALARFWLRGGFAPYVHGPFAESIWGGLTLLLGLAIVLFGTGCIIPWFTFKNMYRVEAAESGVGR